MAPGLFSQIMKNTFKINKNKCTGMRIFFRGVGGLLRMGCWCHNKSPAQVLGFRFDNRYVVTRFCLGPLRLGLKISLKAEQYMLVLQMKNSVNMKKVLTKSKSPYF